MSSTRSKLGDALARLGEGYHPVFATFEVTSRCNAHCAFCYVKESATCDALSTDATRCVIDKLNDSGVMALNITGGEPFLRDDILDILRYCIDKDFFRLTVFTNGTLLAPEHIEFIAENKQYFSKIRMSAFSHLADVNDRYFGVSGALERIVANGRALIAAGLDVQVNVNAMDFNVATIDKTMQFFREQGFIVGYGPNKLVAHSDCAEHVQSMVTQEFFRALTQRLQLGVLQKRQDEMRRAISADSVNPALCPGLRQGITIDSRGGIRPCASFRKLVLGSLLGPESLSEILAASEVYRTIRSLTKLDLKCRTCRLVNYCSPCLGAMHTEYGKMDTPNDYTCNFAYAVERSLTE